MNMIKEVSKYCKREPLVRMASNLKLICLNKEEKVWHKEKKIPNCNFQNNHDFYVSQVNKLRNI